MIVNDPFEGGNHLPDITMIAPVFAGSRQQAMPGFLRRQRAHHADVGGMTPGSLPLSTEIYQEGIIIPPVKLYKRGVLDEDLLRLILRNVRTPDERRGDLAAQRAAAAIGERRLRELVDAFGIDEVLAYATHLQDYSERLTRAAIRQWPDGALSLRRCDRTGGRRAGHAGPHSCDAPPSPATRSPSTSPARRRSCTGRSTPSSPSPSRPATMSCAV